MNSLVIIPTHHSGSYKYEYPPTPVKREFQKDFNKLYQTSNHKVWAVTNRMGLGQAGRGF